MMNSDYLRFNRKERRGILVLIFLTMVAAALARYGKAPAVVVSASAPAWSARPAHAPPAAVAPEPEQLPVLRERTGENRSREYNRDNYKKEYSKKEYRYKGESPKPIRTRGSPWASKQPAYRATYDRNIPAALDINMADTAAFIALPGIGPVLAARIVLFRDKLGGFHSVSQIGEVYGLPDSVFRYLLPRLKCGSPSVRRLPLNIADKETLAAHPYIGWAEAKAIVGYRRQHGPFRSLAELDRILSLDTVVLGKIRPYLAVE